MERKRESVLMKAGEHLYNPTQKALELYSNFEAFCGASIGQSESVKHLVPINRNECVVGGKKTQIHALKICMYCLNEYKLKY
jgi:hypothetical protein